MERIQRLVRFAFCFVILESAQTAHLCAQVTVFSDGFENGFNWFIKDSGQINKWVCDTSVAVYGAYSVYISNTSGATNTYNINVPSVSHLFRQFIIPDSGCSISLNFFVRVEGENTLDLLRVYAVPDSSAIIAGVQLPIANSIQAFSDFSSFFLAHCDLTAYAGDTVWLVFSWINNSSNGTQPPATIDDLTLTYIHTPVNDLPCHAIAINLGDSVFGNCTCASNDSEPVDPPCFLNTQPAYSNSIWYQFIAPSQCIKIRVETETYEHQVALYHRFGALDVCDTLIRIDCSSNTSVCFDNLTLIMDVNSIIPNETYYIRVDGYNDNLGDFTLSVIDGGINCNNVFSTVHGEDCVDHFQVCTPVISMPDQFLGSGNYCDVPWGSYCFNGGERGSSWFEIEIIGDGQLMFDVVPNDYLDINPTDYDFIIWRVQGNDTSTCSLIRNEAVQDSACDYSLASITGCYQNGQVPPNYAGLSASYQREVNVHPGEKYLLLVSNFTGNHTGYTLDFSNTPAGIIDFCHVNTGEIKGPDLISLFPNPTTGKFAIAYTLTDPSLVIIELQDFLGRCVSVLCNEQQSSGTHKINVDSFGISKGVYLVHIQTDRAILSRELVIR